MLTRNNSESCIEKRCVSLVLSLLLLSTVFASTVSYGQTWQRMKMVLPDGYSMLWNATVAFATKDKGWLKTFGTDPSSHAQVSWLFTTSDGGDSWSYQPNTVGSIFVLDSNHIWMRSGNYIFVTKNGGQSFDSLECQISFDKWYFADEEHGVAIATWRDRWQWYTSDGGRSWEIGDTTMYFGNVTDIHFPTPTHGWVVSDNNPFATDIGLVASTTDGGKSWGYQALFPPYHSPRLYGVHFIDSLNGYAIGVGLMRTSDGGKSWSYNSKVGGACITFLSDQKGFFAGWGGIVGITTDAGDSWRLSQTATDAQFTWLKVFPDSEYVYAFGKNTLNEFFLMRARLSQLTAIESAKIAERPEIEVYPNPSHRGISATFTSTARTPVVVTIHTMLGTEMLREVLDYTGTNERIWRWNADLNDLSSSCTFILTIHGEATHASKLFTFIR